VSDSFAAIWERLTKELLASSPLDLLAKVLAGFFFLLVAFLAKKLWSWVWPHVNAWWYLKSTLLARIASLEARLNRGLGAVSRIDHGSHCSEGKGSWLLEPIQPPWPDEQYRMKLLDSIPIWVFANNKGGVAKTTHSCNLAALYALAQQSQPEGKPVLLLDLDYQGSASSMGASDTVRIPSPNHDSLATKLIGGQMTAQDLLNVPTVQHPDMVDGLPLRIVPGYYDLAQAENRLLIQWLFSKELIDIRYQLARILHDPIVQSNFSRVIIDAPPRLTTACIQALCAATHVIIPTVLDRLSGEAVGSYLGQIETLKSAKVCPYIRYAGIVGYRPGSATRHVPDAEDSIRDALRLHALDERLYLAGAVLKHNPLLAESAGQVIGTARTSPKSEVAALRDMYQRVAEAIEVCGER
jgi:cellulose biosynthesis protein BcsQ